MIIKKLVAADELLKYSPHQAQAFYEKAEALAGLDRDEEALICYEKAIKYKYIPKRIG